MKFPALPVADPLATLNFEALQRALPSRVTTLPASPADGQEVYYQSSAMATDGVVWHLRYRSASVSAYKWEFVGGSRWATVATGVTTRAVAAYGDVAAGAAPTFTLPLAGDYIIEVGANLTPGSAGNGMFASFAVGGSTALDTDAALAYGGAGVAPGSWNVHNVAYKAALPAGTTIQQKFKAQGATAGTVDRRYLNIVPVRLG